VSRYSVIVDANQHVLSQRAMTIFQNAPRGLVFERDSPQPNPSPGVLQLTAPPIADRTVQSFAGDPTASPKGWVANNETAGNNAIVGENLLGALPFSNVVTTKAPNGDFSFPLQLGAGAPSPLVYTDAVNTNLFYWINRAHDLHYASGFTEAAGNFQADNFGKGGVQGDAIYAYSHFGTQYPQRAEIENSFYTSIDDVDGSASFVAMFLSFGGAILTDGALDSAVILHEYTHGVSSRLLPRGYDTFQVAAMGEAWSDFYALEYLTPEGAPPDGVYPLTQYFFQTWGQDSVRTRPYSTNMEQNPLTFAQIGNVIPFQEVHADGEIWMEALWEARANLIKQLGEKEGRKRIRTLVLDGMKLTPPGSSMVDMRDAILLADRTDFKGASQDQLWAAFAKRGLGALAYASNPNTTHVLASFALPSDKAQIAFYDDPVPAGALVTVVVEDRNYTEPSMAVQLVSTSGDVETIALRKTGSIYVGTAPTSSNVVNRENGTLNLMTGDAISAFYTDYNAPGGAGQVYTAVSSQNPYYVTASASPTFQFPAERTIAPTTFATKVDLPFDFPFFGKTYRTIFVHDNGLISFGGTADQTAISNGCTDSFSLAEMPTIAPLWLNMTTSGLAQDNEGVFVTRTIANAVTVRWAGETVSNFPVDGSPLNFAATLSYDGTIRFQYGSGNADLGSASNPYYCASAPTVGISPGYGTAALAIAIPTYSNVAINFDPPFGNNSVPTVTLEAPQAGDTVQGMLTVKGIAYDTKSPVYRVDVLIDNVKMATTTANVARPDFCGQQNVRGCPNVGFSTSINTASLKPGSHTLRLRVTNSRGGLTDYPDQPISFNLDAGQARLPVGKLESPAEGAEVKGSLAVRGYAYGPDFRVTSVDTLIDGVTYGPTSYGVRRTDVCSSLNPAPANCPSVGFQLTLSTVSAAPPIANGAHTIQIRVRDESGRYTLMPDTPVNFTVNNGTAASVVGAITSVTSGSTISGSVDISGYAYATGTTIRTGVVFIDGFYSYGTIRYGDARPELCAGLPDVSACPNIGFSATLDTRALSNGPHTIGVALLGANGLEYDLPQVGTPVLSVIVDNH
jgi:hypothetical protein